MTINDQKFTAEQILALALSQPVVRNQKMKCPKCGCCYGQHATYCTDCGDDLIPTGGTHNVRVSDSANVKGTSNAD